MMGRAFAALIIVLVGCAKATTPEISAKSEIPHDEIVSGSSFLTPETLAQQEDNFENPGFIWVEAGAALFEDSTENTPSCASCHEDRLVGAAATYPKIDPETGALLNLEMRVNACRERHQNQTPLSYDSDDLLSLTAFVAHQSKGKVTDVSIDGIAADIYNRGEAAFFTRRGQMNFSCAQCHNDNWGKKLRGDTISQGHGNGFPAYRFEWEEMGSLHRRLQDCDAGVRAEPRPLGDAHYLALELYLAKRAKGLPLESPAIRR